jgi:hypothetical protein
MALATDEERVDAIPHIRWEIEKLVQAFDGYYTRLSADDHDTSIFLEAFLLHARNLIEFFGDQRNKRAVWCGDYGYRRRAKGALLARPYGQQLNDQLAHLTDKRKNPSPRWPYSIFRRLFLEYSAFAAHVDELGNQVADDERKKWAGLSKRVEQSAPPDS